VGWLISVLRKHGIAGKRVLSLGCGNGIAEMLLARRGYRVTGLDSSQDMLNEAARLTAGLRNRIKLIHGDIRGQWPKATFDLVNSHYYTINYITTVAGLQRCFDHVFNCLESAGVFVFDTKHFTTDEPRLDPHGVSTFYYGQDRLHTIRIRKALKNNVVENELINFFRIGIEGLYELARERHRQRFYRADEILRALASAGFKRDDVSVYQYLRFAPPASESERVVYVCAKP
jgi:SAM-dependent methyltransferase